MEYILTPLTLFFFQANCQISLKFIWLKNQFKRIYCIKIVEKSGTFNARRLSSIQMAIANAKQTLKLIWHKKVHVRQVLVYIQEMWGKKKKLKINFNMPNEAKELRRNIPN